MTFSGRVQFRSSSGPSAQTGPPGETEIQQLNPTRKTRILAVTGWPSLAPGSLNLEVDQCVLDDLGRLTPVIIEPGSEVAYPARFQHIPRMRRAYWYYAAFVSNGESRVTALVRRAENPVPGRVELFAAEHLGQRFGLKVGDSLTVEVVTPAHHSAAGA